MLRGCLLLLAILMLASQAHTADNPLLGFSSQEAEREHALMRVLDSETKLGSFSVVLHEIA